MSLIATTLGLIKFVPPPPVSIFSHVTIKTPEQIKPRRAPSKPALTKDEKRTRIVSAIKKFGPMTALQISKHANITAKNLPQNLRDMEKDGLVYALPKKVLSEQGRPAYVWAIK